MTLTSVATTRPSPADLRVRGELNDRARRTGIAASIIALVSAPAWSGFDHLLEPTLAPSFLTVRLMATAVIAVMVVVLWRTDVGRRRPGLCTLAALAALSSTALWMLPQVENVELYLVGASLVLYGSGAGLATHPGWTAGFGTFLFVGTMLVSTTAPDDSALTMSACWWIVGTSAVISFVAHLVRYGSLRSEIRLRTSLEEERHRTDALITELHRVSSQDPLTGAANRRQWQAELDLARRRALAASEAIAVILVDIDHFKAFNDAAGHAAGDRVLCDVTRVLADHVRPGDVVARLGGDEFAILLKKCGMRSAVEVAQRIQRGVARLDPVAPGLPVTLSLGVAGGQVCAAEDEALLLDADAALYRAKESRDTVISASDLAHPDPGHTEGGSRASARDGSPPPTSWDRYLPA